MPEQNSFKELVQRVRAGDQNAATELVREYGDAIRRAARIGLRNAGVGRFLESMDICQSVWGSFFVRAALGQYDLDSSEQLLKLLYSMVHNKVVDAARKPYMDADSAAERAVECDTSPSQYAIRQELVQKSRELLSEEERWLAEQRALGREWAEIAAERGESPEALRKRLARAVERVTIELGLDE